MQHLWEHPLWLLAQEQLKANGSVQVIDHPLMGSMRIVKAPPRFGGEALEPGAPSPEHGQHTREVLKSFSVKEDRLETMFSDGVIS